MIEALKETLGATITFGLLILSIFLWGVISLLIDDIKNYLKN